MMFWVMNTVEGMGIDLSWEKIHSLYTNRYNVMAARDLTEILAMNIWLGIFGVKILTPEWTAWAEAHKPEADALRQQAETMLGAAHSHASQGKNAKTVTTHHHSLGWLFS